MYHRRAYSVLLYYLSRANIRTDALNGVEVFRDDFKIIHRNVKFLLQKHEQAEEGERIQNAGLQQWSVISQRKQVWMIDKFAANVINDDGLQSHSSL